MFIGKASSATSISITTVVVLLFVAFIAFRGTDALSPPVTSCGTTLAEPFTQPVSALEAGAASSHLLPKSDIKEKQKKVGVETMAGIEEARKASEREVSKEMAIAAGQKQQQQVAKGAKAKEGFTGMNVEILPGTYPKETEQPILRDVYPFSGRTGVSADNAKNIWWHFPIFSAGSYEQITNNLRYRYNPDQGVCTAPEFCGALYKSIKNQPNETYPLGPVQGSGVRVGYYVQNV